mgnify:CR=1 FL=1|jgi:hypothetical protein
MGNEIDIQSYRKLNITFNLITACIILIVSEVIGIIEEMV